MIFYIEYHSGQETPTTYINGWKEKLFSIALEVYRTNELYE